MAYLFLYLEVTPGGNVYNKRKQFNLYETTEIKITGSNKGRIK